MNIDLRNISEDFEENVNRIKRDFDINTNSKAVEYAVVNYLKKLEEIKQLKQDLILCRQSANIDYQKIKRFKEAFSDLIEE